MDELEDNKIETFQGDKEITIIKNSNYNDIFIFSPNWQFTV